MTDDALVEESFEIAWNTFEATGELRDRESAATFLSNRIITMVRRGEKRRLLLSIGLLTFTASVIPTSFTSRDKSRLVLFSGFVDEVVAGHWQSATGPLIDLT
jgi:hypothetical protein